MLTRRVLLTVRDPGGEIVGLCGGWGLTSRSTVVRELLTGACRYYVELDRERLDVRALQVGGGYLLTTSPDGLAANHLDQLPDGWLLTRGTGSPKTAVRRC